jgi:hypothetical protein
MKILYYFSNFLYSIFDYNIFFNKLIYNWYEEIDKSILLWLFWLYQVRIFLYCGMAFIYLLFLSGILREDMSFFQRNVKKGEHKNSGEVWWNNFGFTMTQR